MLVLCYVFVLESEVVSVDVVQSGFVDVVIWLILHFPRSCSQGEVVTVVRDCMRSYGIQRAVSCGDIWPGAEVA